MLLSIQEFQNVCQPLLGLPCWHVRWERQLNLSLQFGPPKLAIHEPRQTTQPNALTSKIFAYRQVFVQGSWFLWLDLAYWQLFIGANLPITGSTGRRTMREALSFLDGQYVTNIQVEPGRNTTIWTFDIDATLIIRPSSTAREVTWRLYTPDDMVICMDSNGTIDYHSVDEGQRS